MVGFRQPASRASPRGVFEAGGQDSLVTVGPQSDRTTPIGRLSRIDETVMARFRHDHLSRCDCRWPTRSDRRDAGPALGHLLLVLRTLGVTAPSAAKPTQWTRSYVASMSTWIRCTISPTQCVLHGAICTVSLPVIGVPSISCPVNVAVVSPHWSALALVEKVHTKPLAHRLVRRVRRFRIGRRAARSRHSRVDLECAKAAIRSSGALRRCASQAWVMRSLRRP
jgi:hypothetical protein